MSSSQKKTDVTHFLKSHTMSRKAPQRKKSLSRVVKPKDVKKNGTQKKVLKTMATKNTAEDKSITGNVAASPAVSSKGKDEGQKKEDNKQLLKTVATAPTNEEESLNIAKKKTSESTLSGAGTAIEIKGDRKSIRKEVPCAQPAAPVKGAPDTVDVEISTPNKEASAVRSTSNKTRAKQSYQEKKKSLPQKTALKSQPMQERSIIKLATKVKKRKPKTPRPQKVRSVNEDAYPQPRPGKPLRKKRTKQATKEEDFVPKIDSAFLLPEADMFVQLEKTMDMTVKQSGDTLPKTGLPMVRGNKDNSGVIVIDGQPFWATDIPPKNRPQFGKRVVHQAALVPLWASVASSADDTDDEVVMNAAVLIDVLEKRLKLVPMPDIEIVLDPMEEITTMAARDKTCYSKDVIFGNTVRSMVNLNELSVRALSNRSRKKEVAKVRPDELRKLAMVEPKVMYTYYRATYDKSTPIPFTPTPKAASKPLSCTAELNPFAAVSTLRH